MCVADLGTGADLYTTGAFINAGGASVHHFARWKRAADAGGPFCFGDGSGLACPCGNASTAVDRAGCASSLGTGGRLAGSGQAHVASDSFVLAATQVPLATTALFFQGTSRTNHGGGTAMGDGLRCASGSMVRLGIVHANQGTASFPGVGGTALHVAGNVSPGSTRVYQAMYRNMASFCSASTFNLTNGWIVGWSP
jgi:hypothetical protein